VAGWSGPEGFPAIGDRYAGAVCAQCRTYTTTAPPKRASQCAQGDSNSHGLYRPQGPQPCGAVPVGGEQVVQAGEDRLECCHVGEVDLGDALVAVGLRARGDCCARALCSHTSIRTAGVFASLSAFGWSHSTVSGANRTPIPELHTLSSARPIVVLARDAELCRPYLARAPACDGEERRVFRRTE